MKILSKYFLLASLFLITKFAQAQITVDAMNIYPNPMCLVSTIHFEIVNNDTVTLEVINVLGSTVHTFFSNSLLPSGSYSINFSNDTLPQGIYLIRLQYGFNKVKVLHLVIGCSVSIQNPATTKEFILYPNPATDNFNLQTTQLGTLTVTNQLGQNILNEEIDKGQTTINTNNFSKGIYFVQLKTNDKTFTQEIIVQ